MNSILQVRDSTTGEWINIPALVGPKGEPGTSGVYVGPGEIPKGYNIQIDPTSEAPVLVQSVNGIKPDENGNVEVPTTSDSEYTLPIATPDTLGGVKPVAKSDDMTQSVGVDETGGLWTVPGSDSSGGGNANICNFTTTSEQEVNGITVELPTTLNKFYIVEFRIVFGEVLSQPMVLYSRQGSGSFYGYDTSLPKNTKAATVFGLHFSDEFLHIGFNSAITYEANAFAKFPGMCLRTSQTEKTITFYSNTSGVNFPAGTSISVWGVYEK